MTKDAAEGDKLGPSLRSNPKTSLGAAHQKIKPREFQDTEDLAALVFRNGRDLDWRRVGDWRQGAGGWKVSQGGCWRRGQD